MSDAGHRSPEQLVSGLRETHDDLPQLVGALPSERLAATPADGGWSAREVLAHLADFELIAGVRLRTVLTLDRPGLATYDQEACTARFGALETVDEALERWQVNRRANVRLLEALQPDDWQRTGLHHERGEEPLAKTVAMLLRHDRAHLEQMREAAG
jgi:uncharacterized damage-inducible protein DinB